MNIHYKMVPTLYSGVGGSKLPTFRSVTMSQRNFLCGYDESIHYLSEPNWVPPITEIKTELQQSTEKWTESSVSVDCSFTADKSNDLVDLCCENMFPLSNIFEMKLILTDEASKLDHDPIPIYEPSNLDQDPPPVYTFTKLAIRSSVDTNMPFSPKESTKKQIPLYPLQTLTARKKARQERREERRKLKLKLEEENRKLAATLKELQATLAQLQSQICSSCFAQVQQYLYSHKDDGPDDYRFKLRKCSDSDCKGNDSANVQSLVQNLRI